MSELSCVRRTALDELSILLFIVVCDLGKLQMKMSNTWNLPIAMQFSELKKEKGPESLNPLVVALCDGFSQCGGPKNESSKKAIHSFSAQCIIFVLKLRGHCSDISNDRAPVNADHLSDAKHRNKYERD